MFSYTQNNPVNAIDPDGEETTGEFLNNWAKGVVFDDDRNNRSGARGVAAVLVSSTWDAFGFESLSKVADNSINGRDDMATSDYVWATVEVGTAGVGKAFKSGKEAYDIIKKFIKKYNPHTMRPAHIGNSISFPELKEIAKRLGVNEKKFHKEIKKEILGDFKTEIKKIGASNPDIGVNKAGSIVFKNPKTGKTLVTDIPLKNYKQ